MKKLAIIAFVILILSFIVSMVTAFTTNATITNDIAIDQLNGGDEAYLAMQAYNQYRTIIYGVSSCIIVIAVAVILLIFYKMYVNKHDD